MPKFVYRVLVDVQAKDEADAVNLLDDLVGDLLFRVLNKDREGVVAVDVSHVCAACKQRIGETTDPPQYCQDCGKTMSGG